MVAGEGRKDWWKDGRLSRSGEMENTISGAG